jgi:filamentous hemagglutinin
VKNSTLPPVSAWRRLTTYALSSLLVFQPVMPALAAGVQAATGATQVDQAANSVPVVNIATPNQAGVSHNQYQNFNVGSEGLILNNSTDRLTQSQLGGLIQNNPNLKAGNEAKAIINEVTSANRSQLNGYMEVAGKNASVMVANPYGITCNGCGFINTPNATLTTGKPVMGADGNLQSIDVTQGAITVEGKGLDASQTGYFSLISRATEINAKLSAQDLTVIAGANRVDARGNVTPVAGQGNAPHVAIDTGALGGMYANRIRLVSSETGVGVNLNNINAREGDMLLDASGKLTLSNSAAAGNLTATAQEIQLSGSHKAQSVALTGRGDVQLQNATIAGNENLTLTSGGKLVANGAQMTAGQNVRLASSELTTDAATKIDAQRDVELVQSKNTDWKGQLTAGQDVRISSPTLTNQGKIAANRSVTLSGTAFNNLGSVQSQSDLALNLDTFNNGGHTLAGGSLALNARDVQLGGILSAQQDLTFSGNALTVANTGQLLAGRNLILNTGSFALAGMAKGGQHVSLNGDRFTSANGSLLTSDGDIALTLTDAQIDGQLAALGSLTLSAGNRVITGKTAQLQAQKDLSLTATQSADLLGTEAAKGDITVHAATLTHSGQTAGHSVTLNAQQISNDGNVVADDIHLTAKNLINNGILQGNRALQFDTGAISNLSHGQIVSGGLLKLMLPQFTNAGLVLADDFILSTERLENTGTIQGTGGLTISATTLSNRNSGRLLSGQSLALNTSQLSNDGIVQGDSVTLNSNAFSNQGSVQASALDIRSDAVTNSGTLIGLKTLAMNLLQDLNNTAQGSVLSQGSLSVTARNVSNDGVWQGVNVLLNAQDFTNTGTVQSADALTFSLANTFINTTSGKLIANGAAAIQALSAGNQGQWIARNLTLTAGTLTNSGEITGVDSLTATLQSNLTQQASGKLQSNGLTRIDAATVDNAGQLQTRTLALHASTLTNDGTLQARETASLVLSGQADNRASGLMLSDGSLNLSAASFTNAGIAQGTTDATFNLSESGNNLGRLLSGGVLTLSAPQFRNSGWLQSDSQNINVADTLTNSGTLIAQGKSLFTGGNLTNTGFVQAANLSLNQSVIDNHGTLFATQSLNIQSQNLSNSAAAKLFSAGDITLNSRALTQSGQIVALGNITLTLLDALAQNGTLAAGNNLSVSTEGDFTQNGTLQGQSVALSSSGMFSNQGILTGGNGAFTVNAGSITQANNGSLQSGGDVSLTSRGAIANNGFIGTTGDLLLSAASTLTNTALLYSASDMTLLADAIRNLKGDILAGNSLWMMKDARGSANTEVVNRSGNIETTHGDISIYTGHLLNERDGLSFSKETHDYVSGDQAYIDVLWRDLDPDSLSFDKGTLCGGGVNDHCTTYYYVVVSPSLATQKVLVSDESVTAHADGSAGRIAAGRDLTVQASVLDNNASDILAGGNMSLSGGQLNNNSLETGTVSKYQTYSYTCTKASGCREGISASEYGNQFASSGTLSFELSGAPVYETSNGGYSYRAVIQAGGNLIANFFSDISNTTTTASAGSISHHLVAPALSTLSAPTEFAGEKMQDLPQTSGTDINSPQWRDHVADTIQALGGGTALNTGDYPLPTSSNGYFVINADPKSPYLIVTNPKLDGLGQLDNNLFNEIYAMQGMTAPVVPRETGRQYTDENSFIGSAYFLDRLNLHPDYDYRFLGDAAFDTRYVSNALINATGSRYISGFGSDLAQMQYLMDNAASAQQSLGLAFGVALTRDQIASLDKSILWWENAVVNGQNVLVPRLYLSPKDVAPASGSVIAGNNVGLAGGSITNSGSTLQANSGLYVSSQSTIDNLDAGLMKAGGDLSLFATGDISNIGSSLSGQGVQLISYDGSIINQTLTNQWSISGKSGRDSLAFSHTDIGDIASISAGDSLTMYAGKNIDITGANLTSGGDLTLQALGDINIAALETRDLEQHSSRGKNTLTESSDTQASQISSRGDLAMQAGHDLNISASQVTAEGDAALKAGNDINLQTQEQNAHSKTNKTEQRLDLVDNTTITAGGDLALVAGRDLNSQAASMKAGEDATLAAGRDINLNAEEISSYSESHGNKKQQVEETIRQQSTELVSGGNTHIQAGQDATFNGAQVDATGNLAVTAGRDITLNSVTESDYSFFEQTKTSGGMFSKTTTHTVREDYATHEKGSELGGDNVSMTAGHDLNVNGSSIIGDHNVSLLAGNNINILASTEEQSSYRLDEKKKSGLFSGGGLGFTIGTTETSHRVNEDGTTQSQSASSVGSLGGDVTVMAGNNVHVSGSDIIASEDMLISGKNVQIDPGQDALHRKETFEQKTTGLNITLAGTAGGAVNSGYTAAQSASDDDSGRMAALDGIKAALNGYQAYQGTQLDGNNGGNNSFIGIAASISHQESRSEQITDQHAATGSTVMAGGNATIEARDGDLNVIGSKVKADGDLNLFATDDINLLAADNTQKTTGKNSSAGGDIGISFGVSNDKAGISVFADVNAAAGKNHGDGTTWTNSEVGAGGNLNISAGNDLNIKGAQVSGEQITADIGHNLTIESLQDTDHYDSKQQSAAAGGSFTWGGGGGGYISLSQDKMNSDYASVTDQSGMFAGNGGFDITAGNHTQLNGGVIASGASADKNRLDTGTLGWNDIHNEASYSVDSSSISMSSSGNSTSQFMGNMANAMLAGLNGGGSASSTTGSAIAGGTIVIRDPNAQKQDIANLSRDTDNAHSTLAPIFDAAKEQQHIDENRAIAQIGSQVADIVRTEGKIAAQEAAKEQLAKEGKLPPTPTKGAEQSEWDAYNETLENTDAYKAAMNEYGTGSYKQQAIQAITAAIQGLTGGDWSSAVAGAAAPYMAEFIKNNTAEGAERIISHALAGAIVAEMQGGNAAAGAAGAGLSAAGAKYIADQLYPGKDIKDLTEEEKQGVVALATLASGIAGGVVGGDVSSAIDGAKAGKNEVENNYLHVSEKTELELAKQKLNSSNLAEREQAQQTINELREKDIASDKKVIDACSNGNAGSAACASARLEVIAAKGEYETGNYNNKVSQMYPDAYGQIVNLLNFTSVDAQNQQQVKDAMANYAMSQLGVDKVTAENYVETYDGMQMIASSLKPVLGAAVVSKIGVMTRNIVIYPSGINFRIDQPKHLSMVDGFTQKNGISGGHNSNAFYDAAKEYNVKIVSETPTGVKGITEVKYLIPTKDRAGNLTGDYKATTETKTIYDPKLFSDQKILELGQQAAAKGYKDAMASKNGQANVSVDGVNFRIYVDRTTGTVRNFHPN